MTESFRKLQTSITAGAISTLAVLLATFLITRADRAYNQTYDESAHIACGMQWLSQGTYDYETLHPPLARVATAIVPFIHGSRSQGNPVMLEEGNSLLNLNGQYWKNLLLSRLGVLPFFWLSCFLVFNFMRLHFSLWHGAVAVVLLAFCPIVLAHSSLATTDAPFMAMFLWSVLGLANFLNKPTLLSGLAAAISLGLACLTKFTELPFFALAVVIMLTHRWLSARQILVPLRRVILVVTFAVPVIWAGYRFSYKPIFTPHSISPATQLKLNSMPPRERDLFVNTKVPAGEFFQGLIMAKLVGANGGRTAYLLGRMYYGSRWEYFPVGVLTKTPIPTLVLFALGFSVYLLFNGDWRSRNAAVLVAGLASPMMIGMLANLNIGLRHVLPIFPFIAMFAAIGVLYLWNLPLKYRSLGRVAALLLTGWSVTSCIWASPEFLPYFNVIASPYADRILGGSDLDWGQDLYALESRLKDIPPEEIYMDYFGDPDIVKHNSALWHVMTPEVKPNGWVAISESRIQEKRDAYAWTSTYPYRRVGRSIRLYHFSAPPS